MKKKSKKGVYWGIYENKLSLISIYNGIFYEGEGVHEQEVKHPQMQIFNFWNDQTEYLDEYEFSKVHILEKIKRPKIRF